MAARAMSITGMITPVDLRTPVRRSVAGITPEFYFQKTIDNSRLVRVADPQRRREAAPVLGVLAKAAQFERELRFRDAEFASALEQVARQQRLSLRRREVRTCPYCRGDAPLQANFCGNTGT